MAPSYRTAFKSASTACSIGISVSIHAEDEVIGAKERKADVANCFNVLTSSSLGVRSNMMMNRFIKGDLKPNDKGQARLPESAASNDTKEQEL